MRIALASCSNLPDWEVDDRPLHQAFAAQGIEACVVAWDNPLVKWSEFDACLIRTTWDYTDRPGEYLGWIDRVSRQTRLFNSAQVVRWNTHKKYLRDLESKGVAVVPTVWLAKSSRIDLAGVLRERGWARAFLKPAIGATARETLRFDASTEGLSLAMAHLERLMPQEDMLLQPYLNSVETFGEISAVFIDGDITHTVRKIPVSGDYRVQDDFGARDQPIEFSPTQRDVAINAVRAVGEPLLYARTDFLLDAQGELRLTELEAVEPSLFFRHCPDAAPCLVSALCKRLAAPS